MVVTRLQTKRQALVQKCPNDSLYEFWKQLQLRLLLGHLMEDPVERNITISNLYKYLTSMVPKMNDFVDLNPQTQELITVSITKVKELQKDPLVTPDTVKIFQEYLDTLRLFNLN